MAIEFINERPQKAYPIYLISTNADSGGQLPAAAKLFADAQNFVGAKGDFLLFPCETGDIGGAVFGLGDNDDPFITGKLATLLPEGVWYFEGSVNNPILSLLAMFMGGYKFDRYRSKTTTKTIKIYVEPTIERAELERLCQSIKQTRDLINTPANDMTPYDLQNSVMAVGAQYEAEVEAIIGDELLTKNFPLIHAVGRAGSVAPRLIELKWGHESAPKVTLVGKGVSFDSGGLDLKSAGNMLLMKKDMGGAANVLGLAQLIMDAKLPVRLHLLIPAVENAVAGNAFRPGDILPSRKGLSVEIGNTDAEGRLILADAIAYGDSFSPDLLIDMATLTGAARVALGPDLPAFFSNDEGFADDLMRLGSSLHDPMWRLPLWQPYMKRLDSRNADINNVTSDGFAGSITAGLFLSRFVEKAKTWGHFDIYGWTPDERPGYPIGGEAQCIRALYQSLKYKYA